MKGYLFALSKVEALLTKLVAAVAASAVIRTADLELFEAACASLFAFRMAPNHALRLKCIAAIDAAEALAAKQAASRELFLSGKAEAERRAVAAEAARLVRRELWAHGKAQADAKAEANAAALAEKRALWAAGKAEADARAVAKANDRRAVKAVVATKGAWRVKGTSFTKSEAAELEAAMLAPRVEAE